MPSRAFTSYSPFHRPVTVLARMVAAGGTIGVLKKPGFQ